MNLSLNLSLSHSETFSQVLADWHNPPIKPFRTNIPSVGEAYVPPEGNVRLL